jgi:hypothetical protein
MFAVLQCQLAPVGNATASGFTRDRGLLREFVESGERFNKDWLKYIESSNLDRINQLREDYNRYYLIEKACAYGRDTENEEFKSLPLLDAAFLLERFPLLLLPALA